MLISRRGLIVGGAGLICAPAIVRASSLMPVKAWVDVDMIAAFWANPAAACSVYKLQIVKAFEHLEASTRVIKDGIGNPIRVGLAMHSNPAGCVPNP